MVVGGTDNAGTLSWQPAEPTPESNAGLDSIPELRISLSFHFTPLLTQMNESILLYVCLGKLW